MAEWEGHMAKPEKEHFHLGKATCKILQVRGWQNEHQFLLQALRKISSEGKPHGVQAYPSGEARGGADGGGEARPRREGAQELRQGLGGPFESVLARLAVCG